MQGGCLMDVLEAKKLLEKYGLYDEAECRR